MLEQEKRKNKNLEDFQNSLDLKNKTLEENIRVLTTNYEAEMTYSKNLKEQKDKAISDLETLREEYFKEVNSLESSRTAEIQDLRLKLKSLEDDLVTEKTFSSDLQRQRDRVKENYDRIK